MGEGVYVDAFEGIEQGRILGWVAEDASQEDLRRCGCHADRGAAALLWLLAVLPLLGRRRPAMRTE